MVAMKAWVSGTDTIHAMTVHPPSAQSLLKSLRANRYAFVYCLYKCKEGNAILLNCMMHIKYSQLCHIGLLQNTSLLNLLLRLFT